MGLRSTVDSEHLLYGSRRVFFPVLKLYILQTGLEVKKEGLLQQVRYDIRLSDSYRHVEEKYSEGEVSPDLDVIVHVYDFRMTLDEIVQYIERNILPERFMIYTNEMRDYALTANGITYMQRAVKNRECGKYIMPVNVSTVAEFLGLLIERNIFVDLLTDKEVCDMTIAQFSRDDMLIYQGREEGRTEGKAEAVMELLEDIGGIPDSLRNLIMEQTDGKVLRQWLMAAARAKSVEKFEELVGLVNKEIAK